MPDFDDGHFVMGFSFHIDNGELDSLTREKVFVLGYECAQLVEWATRNFNEIYPGEKVERPFHSDNIDRVRLIMQTIGIPCSISMHDDWPTLIVYKD